MKAIAFCALGAASFLALAASFASASSDNSPRQSQLVVHGTGQGPKTCVDCEAPGPMSVTLCNSATANVSVGGPPVGSFSTGQSTSACVTAPAVAPGKCVWMVYHFDCTMSGFFGTWQCTATGANLMYGDNPYC